MAQAAENRDPERWRNHVARTKDADVIDERGKALDPTQGKARPEGVRHTVERWEGYAQQAKAGSSMQRQPAEKAWGDRVAGARGEEGSRDQQSWRERERPQQKPQEPKPENEQQKQRGGYER